MRDRLERLLGALTRGLYERHEALALGLLALVAGESLFLVGPPGTAKSLLARRLKAALAGARSFEYLMGRFSTPEELFGPLSIAGLRDRDVFERRTAGYLPEADVAFLDEVWRASPPIQNTLLTILNEKRFRNGDHEVRVPLKLLVAASNRTPQGEENAEAFWDRFALRLEVAPVQADSAFAALVSGADDLFRPEVAAEDPLTPEEWDRAQRALDEVALPPTLVAALTALRSALAAEAPPISVSDRRWRKAARLLRASALAHDRAEVDGQDLGVLEHLLWDRPDQRPRVRALLAQVLQEHGWPAPVDLDALEAEVDALANDLRALTRRDRVVVRPRPLVEEGEYHTLRGYPSDLVVRVWAQDYALLTVDAEFDGELFFFSPAGPFRHSEKHALRATGAPAELEVDGRLYALESRSEEVVISDRVPPDGPGLRAWEARARSLGQGLEAARAAVDAEAQRRRTEGQRHLFCAPWTEVCATGLDRDSDDLGALRVRVETLVETRDPD